MIKKMNKEMNEALLENTWLVQLGELISSRVKLHFSKNDVENAGDLSSDLANIRFCPSPISDFVEQRDLSKDAQLLLLLALAPHLDPDFYDRTIQGALPSAGEFPQIGGSRGKTFWGFLPTGETALFVIAGDDFNRRLDVQRLFSLDYLFAKENILRLEVVPEGEPRMSGRMVLSQDFVELFTTGQVARPRLSMNFPAERLETELNWDDLVLHADTLEQVNELEDWVQHGQTLMYEWNMHRKLKPGYRALFHGPPGTGKTLTASLLGKYTERDVYRVDLSAVVSKYIGETEKNLSNLFSKADNKNWILFFDEADALFGKRTNVRDAHDKYANQEVSYLLQRLENYNGLVILATNIKSNIDDAFSRRFQSIVYFPMPGIKERLVLWKKAFPDKIQHANDVDYESLAQKYELTGAAITNVVQYACLRTLSRGEKQITRRDLYKGIKREFEKEGRILR